MKTADCPEIRTAVAVFNQLVKLDYAPADMTVSGGGPEPIWAGPNQSGRAPVSEDH